MITKVKDLKTWSDGEISPFAWQRIMFRHLADFRETGLFLQNIKDDTILEQKILEKINKSYFDVYNIKLPNHLFAN
ncbi:MAG: hypothetical protein EAZ53_04755 [Bacteroidetes bacterium]|nr:MAG: hypothetical protein EAZ53_04755 [Bacteroidota bacterium]